MKITRKEVTVGTFHVFVDSVHVATGYGENLDPLNRLEEELTANPELAREVKEYFALPTKEEREKLWDNAQNSFAQQNQ